MYRLPSVVGTWLTSPPGWGLNFSAQWTVCSDTEIMKHSKYMASTEESSACHKKCTSIIYHIHMTGYRILVLYEHGATEAAASRAECTELKYSCRIGTRRNYCFVHLPRLFSSRTIYACIDCRRPWVHGHILTRVGIEFFRPMDSIFGHGNNCLLYTSPSPRDLSTSRMPSSA